MEEYNDVELVIVSQYMSDFISLHRAWRNARTLGSDALLHLSEGLAFSC